ncbi:Protein of unknown function [Pyronema omphalodes CBS 100304]|uniref:Uncharacterized protein n=1 Tax=Pyronema omphalodes (strain CBS 100304) TaxID=1076935 RepID=U4L0J3_PYROM|nr:Protein of unknown function [Pyronema omphalodes CBS 100304]
MPSRARGRCTTSSTAVATSTTPIRVCTRGLRDTFSSLLLDHNSKRAGSWP